MVPEFPPAAQRAPGNEGRRQPVAGEQDRLAPVRQLPVWSSTKESRLATLETPEYPEKVDAAVLKIAGVVVLGAIMSILGIAVVNVALPTFQTVFGTKRLYLVAIGLFTAGSVLCAAATSINMLMLFRVAQGLGGGMLMSLGKEVRLLPVLLRQPDGTGRVDLPQSRARLDRKVEALRQHGKHVLDELDARLLSATGFPTLFFRSLPSITLTQSST